jgi:serine/threonine protein kinase
MTPPNWDRLQAIYHEALEKPESERIAFLEHACAGNPDLLCQAKSLLESQDATDDILNAPVFEINASHNLIGQMIGDRYLIERKLDGGGMSQVYVALDLNVQRQRVVIKVLSPELVQNSYARTKFGQEIEALRLIHHTNVARVFDAGQLPDGKPYIVMAFVDGETLRSQIKSEGMDLKRVASIIQQIGAALAHVHKLGIFHRDLKPENVMLTSGDDSVVLLDFGIAKVKDSMVAASTVDDVSAGTLPYMSPEQLHGDEITAASDIFSLGLIAYEMVTGRRPFKPAPASQLRELQRGRVRVRPRKLREELSTEAERMILRALSFDPKSRFQNAAVFGDNLARALVAQPKPPVSSGPWARFAGVLIVLGLLSFGLYKVFSNIDGPRAPTRYFTYFLLVQRVSDGKEYQSNGEEPFYNGDKFQLNVLSPVPAYLYVFNEGPSELNDNDTNFRMIYPNRDTNGGSASVGANQAIQSEWLTFHGPPGDDNFWLVWSPTPVAQLESVKTEAFTHPRGGLNDQHLKAVKEFLRTQPRTTIYHYKAAKNAVSRGKSDLLVALAQFEHR